MSTTIDEKVVEMRFDNKHFEKNVQSTLSTLDKLKQKLNLTGASKGLENLNTAANKIDMSGMSNAVDTVKSKFSALEVMGITALANITNSAVNAGKRLVKALTIDPVMSGWQEYELTLNTVQTIMNSTGKSAEEIKEKLKTLDDYADRTVYSTEDMFANIYKFTNAGIDLDTATQAMIGIANATADAGQGAQQASSAYYNLAQSLGTGFLTTIDYKSINLANIVTKDLKQAFADTAIEMGTLKKVGDDLYSTGKKQYNLQQLFNDGLSDQWATADVMMDVFKEYADETTELGKRAWKAATEVRTFTGMMESLKAVAGTGWKRTWELIFGELDEAKEFWTGLSNFISGIISGVAEFRNGILEGALGKGFKYLKNVLSTIMDPMKKTAEVVSKTTSSLKDLGTMVNEVIRGDWGNGEDRFQALTKAGYNYYAIQNKVNETLGCAFRYSDELAGTMWDLNEAQTESAEVQVKLEGTEAERLEQLTKMSDAELKLLGLEQEQIDGLRELRKYSKMTGLSIEEFIANIDEIDGRWLIINSFKNAGQGLVSVFNAIKDAWRETFFGKDATKETVISRLSEALFKAIAAFHKFSTYLKVSDRGAKNLKDTFAGLFAILDMVFTIIGGPIKIVLKLVGQFFKAMDITAAGILEFTGGIGRAISGFHDWFESIFDLSGVFEALAPHIKNAAFYVGEWLKGLKDSEFIKKLGEYISKAVTAIKDWVVSIKDSQWFKDFVNYLKIGAVAVKDWFLGLKDTEAFTKFIDFFKNSKDAIVKWFQGLKEAESIPKYLFEGLINGIVGGAKGVFTFIIDFGKHLLETLRGVLGIHSPSTETYEDGQNLMLGLWNGIKDFAGMIYDLVMSVGKKIIEVVKSLDLGSVFALVMGGGLTYGFIKIAQGFEALVSPLAEFERVAKGFSTKLKADALKSIATAIGILAASVVVLAQLDPKKAWGAVGVVLALAAILGGLSFVIGKYGGDKSLEFGKIALTLMGFGVAMAFMAKAIKTIGTLNLGQAIQGVVAIVAVMVLLMEAMKIVSMTGGNIGTLGKTIMNAATAMLLMAIVLKILAGMKPEDIDQGINVLIKLGLLVAGLMLATKLISGSKNVDKIGGTLAKIAGAMLMMAFVVKILGKMNPDQIKQGLIGIYLFGLLIAGLMYTTKLISGSTNVGKIGGAIAGIAGAMLMMALVVRLLGGMEVGQIIKGTIAIIAFGVLIEGLMWATKFIKGAKDIDKFGKTILTFSVAIMIMAASAALLSLIPIDGLAKGIIAVGFLSLMMIGMVKATEKSKNLMGTMIAMTVAIGLMAASLMVLSALDTTKVAVATACLSAVIGMFALLVLSTSKAKDAMKTIIVMTIAVGALAGCLYLIAKLPAEQTISAAISLGVLLLAMSGVLLILSKMSVSVSNAVKGVVGLLALCVPLVAIAGILILMKHATDATNSATALAGLLLVMSGVLVILGLFGSALLPGAVMGAIGLLALCVPLVAIAGILILMNKVDDATTAVKALSSMLLVMTGVLVILAIVGPMALVGVAALAALTILIGAIGAFAVGIGVLMQKFPQIQSFLDTGLPVLIRLAGAIGEMIGAFVGGIMTQISNSLPAIGTNLSLFMTNLTPFLVGMKMVDGQVLAGAGILAATVIALTAVDFMSSIASFLTGGSSLADLGTQLSQFMVNALPFVILSKQIDPAIMEGIKSLAEAILIITANNVVEGLTSWFTGGSSLEKFATQLPILGQGLSGFITSVGAVTAEQVTTANNAAQIIKTLATAAKEIPNSGGLLADLIGDNDMAFWSAQLPIVGAGIAGFIKIISDAGINSKSADVANNAAEIIKTLATAAKEIPNSGGWLASMIGDNNLETFANQFPNVGKGIVGFIKAMNEGEISADKVEVANTAASIISTLAQASSKIENAGGWLAKLVGDNSLEKFADELPNMGKGIAGFAKEIGEFSSAKLDSVYAACTAMVAIVELSKIDIKDTGDDMEDLADNMVDFAKDFKEFVQKMSEVGADNITAAIDKTKELIEFAQTVSTINVESLKTFGESLKDVAKDGVKKFVDEFDGDSPKSQAKKAVEEMVDAGIDGAKDKEDDMKDEFKALAEEAVNGLSDNKLKDKATTAGKDFCQGLINGLKNQDKRTAVYNAAYSLGALAVQGEKDGQKSKSPSKATTQAGIWLGEGLVIGINQMGKKVYGAGKSMGEEATNSISGALNTAMNLLNSDMDSQPTIRPVVDLSDVESGVGYLNSMFNNGPSLGVMANLGAISSGMNTRNQNGVNDDVVSAINKLRRDLGNVKGDTYNVNGVTYDDGSNITEAVRTLVRAAQIERRV